MTFEFEVDGRVYRVAVEGTWSAAGSAGSFRVHVDDGTPGTPVKQLDVRGTALGLSLIDTADNRCVDAALTEQPAGEWLVQLPHVDVPVLLDLRRTGRTSSGAAAAGGEQRLTAPMPGRVLRILVQPGDEVVARQALVVIEAMKMENELMATRAGRVRDVLVAESTSVEAGRLLIVID